MPRKVMRNEELRAGYPHPIYINAACGLYQPVNYHFLLHNVIFFDKITISVYIYL